MKNTTIKTKRSRLGGIVDRKRKEAGAENEWLSLRNRNLIRRWSFLWFETKDAFNAGPAQASTQNRFPASWKQWFASNSPVRFCQRTAYLNYVTIWPKQCKAKIKTLNKHPRILTE